MKLLLILLGLVPQDPAPTPAKPGIEATVAAMKQKISADRLRTTVQTLVGFGTRHVLSATDDPMHGTGAARSWLEKQLQDLVAGSGGRLVVERETYHVPSQRLRREVDVVNIVATLRGVQDPERIYVVGGHYDSIDSDVTDAKGDAPGANDDASGTALVLEACRAMCTTPLRATIMFVCYDGEEQGLLGSTAHAKALAAKGARVDGMITNDIVGNTLGMDGVRRDGYVRCFSYSPRGNDAGGRSLARAATFAAQRHAAGLDVMLVYRGDRYGRGGDHRPFNAEGWPAIRFTEAREDFSRQHKNVTQRDGKPYGDLPAWVDFDYLVKVTAVNVALLAELAAAPPCPSQVAARGAREAYDTLLSFRPVDGAAGYEAVWRATAAAEWQGSRVLPAALEIDRHGMAGAVLAGQCLDDLVVGVRSIGADGSRSRVATPPEPDAFDQRPAERRTERR